MYNITDRKTVQRVFDEGYEERAYQATKWANGDPSQLDKNDDERIDRPDSWCLWMQRYIGSWNGYKFPHEYDLETLISFRKAMIKVMMLATAAVMWADRKIARDFPMENNNG